MIAKKTEQILIFLFILFLLPYMCLFTSTPIDATINIFNNYNDPVFFDYKRNSSYYGPFNYLFQYCIKDLSYFITHNDQQYFMLILYLFYLRHVFSNEIIPSSLLIVSIYYLFKDPIQNEYRKLGYQVLLPFRC
jgi:hypothetical protein